MEPLYIILIIAVFTAKLLFRITKCAQISSKLNTPQKIRCQTKQAYSSINAKRRILEDTQPQSAGISSIQQLHIRKIRG